MKGDMVYVVRHLKKAEQRLISLHLKQIKKRIFLHQFIDGFPSYRHYGINLGDGTVAHFRGDQFLVQRSAWIQRTSLESFTGGDEICIEDCDYTFSREEVIGRALSQVGCNFGGYNFIFNNCEHFAYWCVTGRRISKQVLFREFDITNVYPKLLLNKKDNKI